MFLFNQLQSSSLNDDAALDVSSALSTYRPPNPRFGS
jgi:hypothetical protein